MKLCYAFRRVNLYPFSAGWRWGIPDGEPVPQPNYRRPGLLWHMEKVLFEKYWFRRWL